ncbi:hypothetical protein [Bacillus sp. FJAT-28004]|uniref:hypothetical protein n=1 Tax=Bacillus sp. FJAT-28004 TaxID=1679165 RepID=UPI0006B41B32|nr:hypothetical protein [Bacillus sp. FJAT-28004]
MKKNKWLAPFGIVILLLFALALWNSYSHLTGAQVKVIEVHETEIKIQDAGGKQDTIQIPKGIHKLIEVDHEYYVNYEHRKWERPTLVSIEP